MSNAPVPIEELVSTVARMERRLSTVPGAVGPLWGVYQRLATRFEHELGASPRDVLLAKSGALMVLQEVVDTGPPEGDELPRRGG